MKQIEPIRLVIATDVRLFAEGLAQALDRRAGLEVVGLANGAAEAMARLRELHPNVLLLDPAMPDSRIVTGTVFESELETKILVLGLAEVETEVIAWATEGIAGFVTRQNSLEQLAITIERVAKDKWSCSPSIMSALLRHLAQLAHARSLGDKAAHLTRREFDVAQLLAHGLSNKQIAHELCISIPTVKNHVHNILTKLDLRNRMDAAWWMRAHAMPRFRDLPTRNAAGRGGSTPTSRPVQASEPETDLTASLSVRVPASVEA